MDIGVSQYHTQNYELCTWERPRIESAHHLLQLRLDVHKAHQVDLILYLFGWRMSICTHKGLHFTVSWLINPVRNETYEWQIYESHRCGSYLISHHTCALPANHSVHMMHC